MKKLLATILFTSIGLMANAQTLVQPRNGGTGISNPNAATLTRTGAHALTLTLTAPTSVTLPTAGTLAILGANTFTGLQTFDAGAAIPTGFNLTGAGTATVTGFTSVSATTGTFTNIGGFALTGGITSATNQAINIGSGALTAGAISGTTGSFSGTLTLSGTAANLATGANFISYGGTDAGLSFDSSNNATLSGKLSAGGGGVNYINHRLINALTSGGASTITIGTAIDGTIQAAAGDTSYQTLVNIAPSSITTQSNSETIALVSTLRLAEPQITKGTDTVTEAATFYIENAPTEGVSNYALRVASGAVSFGGTLGVTGVAAIGAATSPSAALIVQSAGALTGTTQWGLLAYPQFASSATVAAHSIKTYFRTNGSAGTIALGSAINIGTPSFVTTVVTEMHGLLIENITGGGTNYAIKTGTGIVSIGDTTVNMTTSGTTLTVGVGADNGTVSAGVFTDRTKAFDGDALAEITKIKSKNGHIDHDSLPAFARANVKKTAADGSETVEVERDLGAMISMHSTALQQVEARLKAVEARTP